MVNTFNLGPHTLGPNFLTQTEESFSHYIGSLKLEVSIGKIKSIPRIKKIPQPHRMDDETKKCKVCLKKVRSPTALCSGKPKVLAAGEKMENKV